MGYELRLHVGQEWNFDSGITGRWPHSIRELGRFDLSNPGYDSRIYALVRKYQNAEKTRLDAIAPSRHSSRRRNASTYLANDVIIGNREYWLWEDNHGLPLVSIPLSEVREALALDWEDSKSGYRSDYGYRRFYVALAMIDAIIQTFPPETVDDELVAINPLAGQLVVIPWGH